MMKWATGVIARIGANKRLFFGGVLPVTIAILGGTYFRRRRPPQPSPILKTLERSMGDLFGAFRAALKEDAFMREFFVAASKDSAFAVMTPRFRLNADEIPNLLAKVDTLASRGFIRRVNLGDTPIYRLGEALVKYLRGSRPAP